MKATILAVERGEKIIAVSRFFGIPCSTIADHLHGRILTRKKGPPTVLTNSEEKALRSIY